MVPVSSVLCILGYAGGPASNLTQGIISATISFVVATIATYFLGG